MSRYRFLFAFLMVAFAAALIGCSDDQIVNPGTVADLDEAALTAIIDASGDFQHDVVSHAVPDTTASLAAAVTEQYFWWREYTSSARTIAFEFFAADSMHNYPYATAAITTTFNGQFHVVHRDTMGVYTHTTKSLVDVITQKAQFEQMFSETSPNRGWILTDVTNIVGHSEPTTRSIANLNLYPATSPNSSFFNATFMDFHQPAQKPLFELNENVNMMIQSDDGTNVVYRHDWYIGGASRTEVINQDFGFYSDAMTTPTTLTSAEAARVLVIDAIADGVINGSAPYNAYIWAIPYAVNLGGMPR